MVSAIIIVFAVPSLISETLVARSYPKTPARGCPRRQVGRVRTDARDPNEVGRDRAARRHGRGPRRTNQVMRDRGGCREVVTISSVLVYWNNGGLPPESHADSAS